jgi:hypothetical protein
LVFSPVVLKVEMMDYFEVGAMVDCLVGSSVDSLAFEMAPQ